MIDTKFFILLPNLYFLSVLATSYICFKLAHKFEELILKLFGDC